MPISPRIEYIGALWCAPCRTVKPVAELLAHKFGVPITFLEYDEMEEEDKDTVKKLPTIRIREDNKDNTVVHTITAAHADMLEMWLRANVRVNATEDF